MFHLLKKHSHLFAVNQKNIFVGNQVKKNGEVCDLMLIFNLPIEDRQDMFRAKFHSWNALSGNHARL